MSYTNRPESLPTNGSNDTPPPWFFILFVVVVCLWIASPIGLAIGWRLEYNRVNRIKKECAAKIEASRDNDDGAGWSDFPLQTAPHPDGGSSNDFIEWNFNRAARGDDMRWDRIDHTWRDREFHMDTMKKRAADYAPPLSKYDSTPHRQRENAEYDRLSLEWEKEMREEFGTPQP